MADVSRRILVASRNPKKLRELRRVLADSGVVGLELVGLDEVPTFPETPETGATFEANAVVKARVGAAASGLPCVADDSGLEVDALNGMPGVLSARWSGRHGDDLANTVLLLGQLADVPDDRRAARFVSACALATPEGDETVVRGEWTGTIAREPHGDGGFGYDPVFVPTDQTRSAAQLTSEEKDAASHRGRALRLLLPALRELASRV